MNEDCLKPLEDTELVLELLQKISILGGLNKEQLDEIFRLSFIGEFTKDTILFDIGDSANYIYILIKGAIELSFFYKDSDLRLINFRVGDCFGEASLIAIEPHTGTAKCKEDCELILLPRKALLVLHKKNPDLFGRLILNIARELGRRLHETNNLLFECRASKLCSCKID